MLIVSLLRELYMTASTIGYITCKHFLLETHLIIFVELREVSSFYLSLKYILL